MRELYKNVTKYKDWKLTYTGTVLTIFSDTNGSQVQVSVSYDPSNPYLTDNIVLFYGAGVDTSAILEGDHVVVWGRPFGMLSFQNALGATLQNPEFNGDYITKG